MLQTRLIFIFLYFYFINKLLFDHLFNIILANNFLNNNFLFCLFIYLTIRIVINLRYELLKREIKLDYCFILIYLYLYIYLEDLIFCLMQIVNFMKLHISGKKDFQYICYDHSLCFIKKG